MVVAGDGAVNVGSGSWRGGVIAQPISGRITRDNCVFQSYRSWSHSNAAASTFGYRLRRLVRSTLIDTGVAGLSVVKADRAVLNIQSGRIVVRNSTAERWATLTMKAGSTISLSTVTAVAAISRIAGKGRFVDN